jgi:hypothetical protein
MTVGKVSVRDSTGPIWVELTRISVKEMECIGEPSADITVSVSTNRSPSRPTWPRTVQLDPPLRSTETFAVYVMGADCLQPSGRALTTIGGTKGPCPGRGVAVIGGGTGARV